jgi:hypothetical protein
MLGITYVAVDGEIIYENPASIPTGERISAFDNNIIGDTLSLNDQKTRIGEITIEKS